MSAVEAVAYFLARSLSERTHDEHMNGFEAEKRDAVPDFILMVLDINDFVTVLALRLKKR